MSLVFEVSPRTSDGVVRIKVRGDLDIGSAKEGKGAFEAIMQLHPRRIEADLSELTFRDSVGLGVFLEAQLALQELSIVLQIVTASDQVRRLFDVGC